MFGEKGTVCDSNSVGDLILLKVNSKGQCGLLSFTSVTVCALGRLLGLTGQCLLALSGVWVASAAS